jgi:hypothetical protein
MTHRTLQRRIGRIERIFEGQLLPPTPAGGCICYPYYDASFHNTEEMEKALGIPCPTHGKPRFRACIVHLGIDAPLAPADRHLCHCPPMLLRSAAERGRVLTGEELNRAQAQYIEYWEQTAQAGPKNDKAPGLWAAGRLLISP